MKKSFQKKKKNLRFLCAHDQPRKEKKKIKNPLKKRKYNGKIKKYKKYSLPGPCDCDRLHPYDREQCHPCDGDQLHPDGGVPLFHHDNDRHLLCDREKYAHDRNVLCVHDASIQGQSNRRGCENVGGAQS